MFKSTIFQNESGFLNIWIRIPIANADPDPASQLSTDPSPSFNHFGLSVVKMPVKMAASDQMPGAHPAR
jgi:hypothetical protein